MGMGSKPVSEKKQKDTEKKRVMNQFESLATAFE
jgi:hypothetical protein